MKQILHTEIQAIAKLLDAEINGPKSKEAKQTATDRLNALKQVLLAQANRSLIASMYISLVESDAFTANKAVLGFFKAYAAESLKNTPALDVHINKIRAMPERLLKYILLLQAVKLHHLIRISKTTTKDSWIDPITGKVMDYPVSYVINNVEFTVDLFSLLINSKQSIALKCPLTSQYLFLADLRPRIDIVHEITELFSSLELPSIKNLNTTYFLVANLIQNNALDALKELFELIHDLDVNLTDENNSTFLHFACELGHFEIATWMLSVGANIYAPNNHEKFPFQLINPKKLEDAIAANPNDPGLLFFQTMLIKNGNEVKRDKKLQDKCTANMEAAVRCNYIPAMCIYGMLLTMSEDPHQVLKGIEILKKAIKLGSGMAGVSLYAVLFKVLPNKPQMQQLFSADNHTFIVNTNPDNPSISPLSVGTAVVNPATILEDILAVLGSDNKILGEKFLEETAAEMLLAQAKKAPKNTGYDNVMSFCFATRAAFKDESKKELLINAVTQLGLNNVGTNILKNIENKGSAVLYEETLNRVYETGIIKPWVPIKHKMY